VDLKGGPSKQGPSLLIKRVNMMKIIVELSKESLAVLQKQVNGTGGWQDLLRKIQQNINGNELILSVEDVARIIRYSIKYGEGGFENRLFPVTNEIVKLTNALLDPLGYSPVIIP
jgi:hypothetical protein